MRERIYSCFWVVLAVGALAATARADEEEAVKVYRDVHPAVVALQNMEGGGTGILLDSTGLILSNAHVVSSPLRFKCKVDLQRGDKLETVTFKRVKVLGVHPKQDLALVRIDPKEHPGTLQPARLARQKGTPGQRVYAIGNPAGGGMVLNKTITSGILSGVDRVLEGVAYYQISAPINPGNSGGPLCDKGGEVLGLVTLKLTDVENVGFAIPLTALKTSEFVPLSKRKGDPEENRKIVTEAKRYFDRAVAIRKSQRESDQMEAKFYEAMAAKLYHLALANDPSNDSLYYNVGMLLRGLDADEVAAAYLLQAIELNPWNNGSAEYYRELGFALVKQKKKDEARIAWEEGIAKSPMRTPKIWEDLAIFYMNDTPDPYKAAYAAAAAIEIGDPQARLAMLKKLLEEAQEKLEPKDKKRLEAVMAKMTPELRRRQANAEKLLQTRKPYLNESFANYVKSNGSLVDQPDDLATLVRVKPEPPSKTPAEKPVTVEKPVPVENRVQILDLTVPPGSIDLLREVDLAKGPVKGEWKFTGRTLVSPMAPYARLQIPVKLPEEYDLTLIAQRKANRRELVVGLVRGGAQTALFLDADGGQASGLDPAASGAYRGQVFKDRPVTIVCKVRREGLMVTADGQKLFVERRSDAFPPVPEDWAVPESAAIFVGSQSSRYVLLKLMVTPYERKK